MLADGAFAHVYVSRTELDRTKLIVPIMRSNGIQMSICRWNTHGQIWANRLNERWRRPQCIRVGESRTARTECKIKWFLLLLLCHIVDRCDDTHTHTHTHGSWVCVVEIPYRCWKWQPTTSTTASRVCEYNFWWQNEWATRTKKKNRNSFPMNKNKKLWNKMKWKMWFGDNRHRRCTCVSKLWGGKPK